jgi:hypothetical protein
MGATKASAAKAESLYGVHPGIAMVQKWVSELKEKTGRSLEEWIAATKKEAPKGENEIREWLKWSEPLKWHTKLGTVSGKGNTGGEKEILPEISANGCRTDGDLRRCR